MATFTNRRVARKRHICGSGCVIEPRESYLLHAATPNDNDIGNTHWWHVRECARCASRYGRAALLAPPQGGEQ